MRCQYGQGGLCLEDAIDKSKYCSKHQVGRKAMSNTPAGIYKKMQWSQRIGDFANHEKAKNLRDEIGILRLLLEERLSICKDSSDLMLHTGPITNLVDKIESTVASCHKLEAAMGNLLDKNTLIMFADQVIRLIGESFPSAPPEVMAALGDKIAQAAINPAAVTQNPGPVPTTKAQGVELDDEQDA